MIYHYKIYGLHIQSTRKIELLPPATSSPADLEICWTTDAGDSPDAELEWNEVISEELDRRNGISLFTAESPGGVFTKLIYRTDLGQLVFLLDPKKQKLWIIHHPEELRSDLESYLVGPVLGCVLRMRGVVCLHSSVINIDGKGVALLGKKRTGKSTTAAGLAQAGAKVLADDIAVLNQTKGNFTVASGYPSVRLRPAAADHLTVNTDSLPIVYSDRDSRYFSLIKDDKFSAESLPLRAIYVLGEISEDRAEPFIREIESREKLVKLVENTFGSYVVTNEQRSQEFNFLAQIAREVPVRKLFYSHDLENLDRLSQTIISDFRKCVAVPEQANGNSPDNKVIITRA